MSDEEFYYEDDDGDYQYDENDLYREENAGSKPDLGPRQSISDTLSGLEYSGDSGDVSTVPSRNAIMSVYRQLAKFCHVDVDPGFYSATLNIKTGQEIVIAQILFTSGADTGISFPDVPPRFSLHSHFKRPHEHLNIIYNCHPLLLKHRWNICTDLSKIVTDIAAVGKVAHIDGVEDEGSCTQLVIELIITNGVDISGLYPNSEFGLLPFFSPIRPTEQQKGSGFPKGTGFSPGFLGSAGVARTQVDTESMTQTKDILLRLSSRLSALCGKDKALDHEEEPSPSCVNCLAFGLDQGVVDAIYYALDMVVSLSVPLMEFFDGIEYYTPVLSCLEQLPPPSIHIPFVRGLRNLYTELYGRDGSITNAQMLKVLETLDENDKRALELLKKVVIQNMARSSSPSSAALNAGNTNALREAAETTGGRDSGSASALSTLPTTTGLLGRAVKKLFGADQGRVLETKTDNIAIKVDAVPGSRPDIDRVIYPEKPFDAHLFSTAAAAVSTLPAKWYRRVRIELCSMRDSLPDNVVVFSGMEASQPNLLRIVMCPESPDTPYCGGAFEFDVFIPPSYPSDPPKALFRTTGGGSVRFNPNLYSSGKVCLSLLGTWPGEKWDADTSNLAQVVNSILFLIFVEDPYFNEPGYQSQMGTPTGMQNSERYNKVIRIGTLRYGYLEHLQDATRTDSVKKNQFRQYIVPLVAYHWLRAGHKAGLDWGSMDSAVLKLVNSIDRLLPDALNAVSSLDKA